MKFSVTSETRRVFIILVFGVSIRLLIWSCFEGNISLGNKGRLWQLTEEAMLASQTPITSYQSLQEAEALIQLQTKLYHSSPRHSKRSFTPYVNDIVRIPPLVLYFLHSLGCLSSRLRQFIFILSVESITALILGFTVSKLRRQQSRRIDLSINVRRRNSLSNGDDSDECPKECPKECLKECPKECPEEHFVECNQIQSDSPTEKHSPSWNWFVSVDYQSLCEPSIIIAIYILNPINILSSLTLSLDPLRLLFLASAFASTVASQSYYSIIPASVSLAFLAYVIPLPSVIGLVIASGHAITAAHQSFKTKDYFNIFLPISFLDYFKNYWICSTIPLLFATSTIFLFLHYLSFIFMNDSWDYFDSCVTAILIVRDLTPNIGIFWYILQLVFLRARHVFIAAFQSINLVIALPLSFKFIRQPLSLMQIASSVFLLFATHPTMINFSFTIVLLIIDIAVIRKLKEFTALVASCCFTLALVPVMGNLWLRRNSGNPNFLYSAQLAFNVLSGLLITRFATASLKLHSGDTGIVGDINLTKSDKQEKSKTD